MAERLNDLPEECWELIFNRLDHHSHFEPLSSVCKQFHSLTNRLRFTLTIIDSTILVHGTISKLIQRFQHLKTIDLSQFHGNIDTIIIEIANSPLFNLEAIDISNQNRIPIKGLKEFESNSKRLKVLKCSNLCVLSDSDLVFIANSLMYLEELDISYPRNNYCLDSNSDEFIVSDIGIEALSNHLENLLKINLSGNDFITDMSVMFLSSNCLLLREMLLLDCSFLTQNGICFVLNNSPYLSSILVSGIQIPLRFSPFEVSFAYARALCTIEFYDLVISDELLYSLAKACIPLKRFLLSWCMNFTFSGISFLLRTYPSLEYLALVKVDFLTDRSMTDLSKYLQNLVSTKLNLCSKLTFSTLFTLVKNCPLLKDIEMERINLDKEDCFRDSVKNPRIKSLSLARNSSLTDECLQKIISMCPKLELLDVSSCSGIKEGAITEIFKSCHEMRHLRIDECEGIKNIGKSEGSRFSKLEVLCARMSGISDEVLATIGKRSVGILKLDLAGCKGVTTKGVEEVVSNCERLREINLKSCHNVNAGIVDWLVFSRPSLKKIIPPCYSFFTKNQRKLFLWHGCQVCES